MNPCHNQEKTEEAAIVEKKKSPAYLVFYHGRIERSQIFFSLSDESYSVKSIPEMGGTMSCWASWTCWASCQGWLVMVENNSTSCFLLNLVTMEKVELPPVEYYDHFYACVITSSPHTPNCVVMFVSGSRLCKFCRPGDDDKWTEQDLIPRDYNNGERDDNFRYAKAAVSCKGRIYISFGERGMVVMEQTGGDTGDDDINDNNKGGLLFKIRPVIMKKHNEYRVHPLCFEQSILHLVESCGVVFMVSKHYKGNSKEVFDFMVYRLDFLTMDWEHTISLGDDRVFLLGNTYSLSASASEMGGRIMKGGNCIYFFEPEDRNLYKYCMKEEHISSFLPCPNVVRKWSAPYWMQPLV